MKKYILNISTAFLITLILFTGCDSSFLEETPPHIITAESLYKNLEGFETGLNGLYALVRGEREGRADGGSNWLRAAWWMEGTDVLVPNHRDGFGYVAEGWQERNNPFSDEFKSMFLWLYEIINTANTIIERTENPDVKWTGGGKTAEENKSRVIAEARVMRAWAYRHLAFSFGDVPLTLNESVGSTIRTDWERTPVAQVWDQVKSDLLFGEKYITVEPSKQGKITKGAIQTYLAELYLTINKPDSALFWSNKCINTPEYKLITQRYGVKANQPGVPFADMFFDGNSNREEGNTEALWTFQFEQETVGGGASNMRRWFGTRYYSLKIGSVTPLQVTVERGGRPQARVSLTKYAIDVYEPKDDRYSNYIFRRFYILRDAKQNDTGVADNLPKGYSQGDTIWTKAAKDLSPDYKQSAIYDWPYTRKWDWADPANVTIATQYNDQIYLRLAETYLLKAEAQMKTGDLAGAAQTLNVIRSRAHTSTITADQVNLDFILDERARELITEEHRRHTLVRTGKWLERVQKYNHNGGQFTTERDALFPIPQVVIDANLTREMPQNPGY